jgi:hypothetical protein
MENPGKVSTFLREFSFHVEGNSFPGKHVGKFYEISLQKKNQRREKINGTKVK